MNPEAGFKDLLTIIQFRTMREKIIKIATIQQIEEFYKIFLAGQVLDRSVP